MQKFISNLSDKERKIFYIAVIIVFAFLVDMLFLRPAAKKVKAIEMKIIEQEASVERDVRILARKEMITKTSEAFDNYYTKKMLSSDDINGAFLSSVTRLAGETNVNLVKSNPTDIKKSKKYIEYFANVDCVGKLDDVVSFMHAVNSTENLFKIVRFNMTPKRGTSSDVNASMTIVKLLISPDMNNVTEEDQSEQTQ